MEVVNLVTWAVFLMVFVKYPKAAGVSNLKAYQLSVEIIAGTQGKQPPPSIDGCCCSNDKRAYKLNSNKFTLDCGKDFWDQECYILLQHNETIRAEMVKITNKKSGKMYEVPFVKSFQPLRFTRAEEKSSGITWKLVVNTANNSGIVRGRIYFRLNCDYGPPVLVSLAKSFDNFKPGRTDTFEFTGRETMSTNLCVSIFDSLIENWIMSSMTVTDTKYNKDYTFYHGEKTNHQSYYTYIGDDPVNWEIEVVTGAVGTDSSIIVQVISDNCRSKFTLDNINDNFEPNSTDYFKVGVRNCSKLTQIKIFNENFGSKWVLVKMNLTRENGNSYTFYHNETLKSVHVFNVSQESGDNKWDVSVCTNTSTDDMVFITLFGDKDTSEKLRLTTADDDFEAVQCSNFNLSLKDIGNLWMIEIEKPGKLLINTTTLENNGNSYEFIAPYEDPPFKKSKLRLVYYKKGAWLFRPNLPRGGEKERECANNCIKNSCKQFHIVQDKCKIAPSTNNATTYTFDPSITVWSLDIRFPIAVSGVRIRFIQKDAATFIIPIPDSKKTFHQTFSTLTKFFGKVKYLYLEALHIVHCGQTSIDLTKTTAEKTEYLKVESQGPCNWRINGVKAPPTTTTPIASTSLTWALLTNTESKISRLSTDTESTISALPTNTQSTNSALTTTESITYPNNTIELSTVPHSTISRRNDSITNDSITEAEIPEKGENRTICKCFYEKILSKEEQAEKMEALVKELKVNKNETTSYLRSKISAPDERASSKVIGSTAVIVMAIPFGLIVLVDLIPILNLLYQKVISLL